MSTSPNNQQANNKEESSIDCDDGGGKDVSQNIPLTQSLSLPSSPQQPPPPPSCSTALVLANPKNEGDEINTQYNNYVINSALSSADSNNEEETTETNNSTEPANNFLTEEEQPLPIVANHNISSISNNTSMKSETSTETAEPNLPSPQKNGEIASSAIFISVPLHKNSVLIKQNEAQFCDNSNTREEISSDHPITPPPTTQTHLARSDSNHYGSFSHEHSPNIETKHNLETSAEQQCISHSPTTMSSSSLPLSDTPKTTEMSPVHSKKTESSDAITMLLDEETGSIHDDTNNDPQPIISTSKSETHSPSNETTKTIDCDSPQKETQHIAFTFEQPTTNNQKNTRQNNNRNNSRRPRSAIGILWACIGPYKIPLLLLISVYLLLATGGAAYLLQKFLEIPGLQTQVDRLENQVDELEFQVDRFETQVDELSTQVDLLGDEVDQLSVENDRFTAENDKLEKNNEDFSVLNQELQRNNEEYKSLNLLLNQSNEEFGRNNVMLRESNANYDILNGILNLTVQNLDMKVDALEIVSANLTKTVTKYEELNTELELNVDDLTTQNALLQTSIQELDVQVDKLEINNDYYRELNQNLTTIVSFLDDTSQTIDESFQDMVAYLTLTIKTNRHLVVENVHLNMETKEEGWRCRVEDAFGGDWVTDPTNVPIGSNEYTNFLKWIDEILFSELCISVDNVEAYLADRYGVEVNDLSTITLSEFSRGVHWYNLAVLNHYFPDENEEGITEEEWEGAQFKCANLPLDKRYLWIKLF